jgi:hypothetical protein
VSTGNNDPRAFTREGHGRGATDAGQCAGDLEQLVNSYLLPPYRDPCRSGMTDANAVFGIA